MKQAAYALLVFVFASNAAASRTLRKIQAHNRTNSSHSQNVATFAAYYDTVTTGRGIWKWNNALVAYDRHLLQFQGKAVNGAEVGVQSGGSMQMWHTVLGPHAVLHGLDINPMCSQFVDEKTSITIGDQENPEMWNSFFAHVSSTLDFLVDDGGHFPKQMLQTIYSVFPKLNKDGVIAIEDIHGAHYLQSFFEPAAQYFGPNVEVASIHLYPYLVVVHKVGVGAAYDPTKQPNAKVSATVTSLSDLVLQGAAPGTLLVLQNPSWGRFINPSGLSYFFKTFIDLYQPQSMPDNPPGCADTSAPVCTSGTLNSVMQSQVQGVHILPDKLVVEIPAQPPVIQAVRHGDQWVRRPENNEIPERLQNALQGTGHAQHLLPTAR
jgi:hypothetical protein